jgi:toxin-antitoxin system PIN domain toxin
VFVVDTNVLVYAADVDSPYHDPCREALEHWRGLASAWYVTWGILYEFLRVMTHRRVIRQPLSIAESWGFVEAVLASRGLGVLVPTERHGDVATEVFEELPHLSGSLLHDANTAILMREHGIHRIYTRDMDFHHFPFLQPLDPLAEAD